MQKLLVLDRFRAITVMVNIGAALLVPLTKQPRRLAAYRGCPLGLLRCIASLRSLAG